MWLKNVKRQHIKNSFHDMLPKDNAHTCIKDHPVFNTIATFLLYNSFKKNLATSNEIILADLIIFSKKKIKINLQSTHWKNNKLATYHEFMRK